MVRWVLLALLFSSTRLGAADPHFSAADLDQLVSTARELWPVPGLAICVITPDQPPITKGYGLRQVTPAQPVTPDTLFPIASCTKAFTSTLFAQLVDEGRLGWNDPVVKHWPEFKWSDPHVTALLTVRDLLSHRSGLAGHDLLWYRAPWTLDEVLKRAESLPIEGQFRHTYHYSSIPVLAAGRLAERLTRKQWPELIQANLAKPLDIQPITFTTEQLRAQNNRAIGYRRSAAVTPELMPEYLVAEANPAGSIALNARGLEAWLGFLLRGGTTATGRRLVSEENFRVTTTPHVHMPRDSVIAPLYPLSKQVSYCLGWVQFDYRGELAYAHGGMIDGFRCQITWIPARKIGVAILNNLHDSKLNIGLSYAILDRLLKQTDQDWLKHFDKVEAEERAAKAANLKQRDAVRKPNTTPTHPLEKYCGEYQHPAYGKLTIRLAEQRLHWSWSGFQSDLEHFQFDTFRIREGYSAEELLEFGGTAAAVQAVRVFGQVFKKAN